MITRRGMLGGLLAAPAIIRTPGLLMPVRPVVTVASGTHVEWYHIGDVVYLPPRVHCVDQPGIAWSVAHDATSWTPNGASAEFPKRQRRTWVEGVGTPPASRHRRG